VRAQADAHVKAARDALEALRVEHRRERAWTRPTGTTTATPAKVARAESDHAVEVNLTPDELIVWRQVKRKIHASARMSRTEAFAHWLHDHSGEVARMLEADAERGYREALKREKRERQELKEAMRSPVKMRELVHAELDAVPF
jgi:NAD dependent epimerase/dehydratase family enzyme